MIAVAAVQIPAEGVGDFGMTGIVRGIQHELAQRVEVALDAIHVAGGRRSWHEFDVVQLGPFPDLGRPVQRQVVVDQVDPHMRRVPAANLLVEREHFASGFGQTLAAEQHVGVDVVATEKVANTTPPGVGGPLPPGSFPLRVAVAGVGLQRDRPELIETHHHPVNRAGTVQVEHARGFFFEARVGAAFPGARALEGDLLFEQDSPERLERDGRTTRRRSK